MMGLSDYNAIIQTPISKLGIYIVTQQLSRIDFLADDVPLLDPTEILACHIVTELNHYFRDPTFQFSIPYHLSGTPFQERVWKALIRLPIQKTVTYGTLAKEIMTSARAIGLACRTNPLPILIPCHRVVAQQGLGGYQGKKNIAIKKWLLNHEAIT